MDEVANANFTRGPEARARVLAVIDAARDLLNDAPSRERLVCDLAHATRLSREGIALALSEHLETHPTDAEVDALIASAPVSGGAAHVVLSAHVCTAALRAIAIAVAAHARVFVKPSRRDPILARALVARVAGVSLCDRIEPAIGDVVFAYGADATLETIFASLPAGVRFAGHGSGFGVAVVGDVDVSLAAESLARDVVPFDQAGCLSPRVVLVEGDAARGEAFCEALDRALAAWEVRVPRGLLADGDAAAITSYERLLAAVGATWRGNAHLIGFDPSPRALVLPPALRVVHVVSVPSSVASLFAHPWGRLVTTIGVLGAPLFLDDLVRACDTPRITPLGSMQKPPFDGPVDRRSSQQLVRLK